MNAVKRRRVSWALAIGLRIGCGGPIEAKRCDVVDVLAPFGPTLFSPSLGAFPHPSPVVGASKWQYQVVANDVTGTACADLLSCEANCVNGCAGRCDVFAGGVSCCLDLPA